MAARKIIERRAKNLIGAQDLLASRASVSLEVHVLFKSYHRDLVFVAGGMPTVTYVEREEQHIERNLARAIATPSQIVSLAGPTKTGKTVLCKRVLGDREYVWIDGGQVSSVDSFWQQVATELKIPSETTSTVSTNTSADVSASALLVTAKGSLLRGDSFSERQSINSMSEAIAVLIRDRIVLVIDDFHYLEEPVRQELMRNVKGAVFNGLKVLLLSVTHRAFDAIKAETELTGRFIAIDLPHWSLSDLQKIPEQGFSALAVQCPPSLIAKLCSEAQENPSLLQRFCWEICFDLKIEHAATILTAKNIPVEYDLDAMFERIAGDAGLPIYQQLAAGPPIRKAREKRPLKDGTDADIYQVTLLALAETGPKVAVRYEELRAALIHLLADRIPQKHEVTSALKHLAKISRKNRFESVIDWDENKREVNVADPYLRFFLRWKIRDRSKDSLFAPIGAG